MDTDEYSPLHPKEQWGYLKTGIMVESERMGLVHYTEPDEDMVLIERGGRRDPTAALRGSFGGRRRST
jgi:hypothetical protein